MRLRARGSLRAMWPGEDPCSRDRMRWVHRATCCGEAAAPQGVDRLSAEWGDQAWYDVVLGKVPATSGRWTARCKAVKWAAWRGSGRAEGEGSGGIT
jgi:hypothetical protein